MFMNSYFPLLVHTVNIFSKVRSPSLARCLAPNYCVFPAVGWWTAEHLTVQGLHTDVRKRSSLHELACRAGISTSCLYRSYNVDIRVARYILQCMKKSCIKFTRMKLTLELGLSITIWFRSTLMSTEIKYHKMSRL